MYDGAGAEGGGDAARDSAAGNIPKIAVSMGNTDHLDQILTQLGITEWDCYEGRASPSTTKTCTPAVNPTTKADYTIADVLTNTNPATGPAITSYHMAFISCAPDAYSTYVTATGSMSLGGHPGKGYSQATMTTNTQTWAGGGGRMFVTDTSYDYIGQPFPAAIPWQKETGTTAGGIDGANVGCAPAPTGGGSAHAVSYPVTIDEATLAAWLKLPAIGFPTSPNVQIQGFYEPWSTMATFPMASTTTEIAHGTMPLDLSYSSTMCASPAMTSVPLTAEFDVGHCGRMVFSSYHTYSGTGASASAANAKIMEFLIFGAATCQQ